MMKETQMGGVANSKASSPVLAGSMNRRDVLGALMLAVPAMAISSTAALAQTAAFPDKPVRIVVPFAAGGPTDITARVIGERLATLWGQSVVIENKAGAGGNLGSEQVARSAPDGTLIVLGVTGSHAINTSLMKSMPYHPLNDFEPITQATSFPNAITVHPSLGVSNLTEFVALIKREPGRHTYGHDGVGTASHLTMELLKARAGLDIPAVPYRGGSPMANDLVAGHIKIGITGLPTLQPYISAGQIRAIGVTTAQRSSASPGSPTLKEQGLDLVAAPWSGFFAPKGTPAPIVNKLAADIVAVMTEASIRDRMISLGNTPAPSNPAAFRSFVEAEIKQWAEAVRISGAKVE